jgi:hypothetical protein
LVMPLYDTHEAETLGRNWYIALSGGFTTRDATDALPYLGGLTTRDATDTLSWPRDATRTSPFSYVAWSISQFILSYKNIKCLPRRYYPCAYKDDLGCCVLLRYYWWSLSRLMFLVLCLRLLHQIFNLVKGSY